MADIARKASAHWMGDLKEGKGTVSTESGTLKETNYSFQTRFESGTGTNPEELLASSHAGCFTMQLSALLGMNGHQPQDLKTEATCEMVKVDPGFKVSAMHLVVHGKVDNCDQATFERYVADATSMCPISKIMQGNVEITHKAVLE